MSSTRRIISFVIALTLTVVGWGFVAYFLLFADGWRGVVVLAAGFVGSLGMFWLYEDFIDATPNKH
jgi:CHASE2 domain-containing sensor protein